MLYTYHPQVEEGLYKESNCQKIPMTAAYWVKEFERSLRGHTEDIPSDSLPSSTKLGSQKSPENNSIKFYSESVVEDTQHQKCTDSVKA